MARQSTLLLSTTANNGVLGTFAGAAVRADGWYGRVDHLYTTAVYVSNFQGSVYIEASLADVPGDADWFSVVTPLVFPQTQIPNAGPGDNAALVFTFRTNVTWIRARAIHTGSGFVDRILLNQ